MIFGNLNDFLMLSISGTLIYILSNTIVSYFNEPHKYSEPKYDILTSCYKILFKVGCDMIFKYIDYLIYLNLFFNPLFLPLIYKINFTKVFIKIALLIYKKEYQKILNTVLNELIKSFYYLPTCFNSVTTCLALGVDINFISSIFIYSITLYFLKYVNFGISYYIILDFITKNYLINN